jgi:alanine racemase
MLSQKSTLEHDRGMPKKSPVLPDRTWVEIDRGALRRNLKAVRKLAGKAGIMAVVKANAYGHGLEEVARVLDGGVEVFAVASLGEALQLRNVQKRTPILLLSAALPAEYEKIAREGFIPTISSSKEAALFAKHAPKGAAVHFKVDTGMGRLGALPENAIPTLKSILKTGLTVQSVSTHLSSADSDQKTTAHQLAVFAELLEELQILAPDAAIHALNSAGAILHASEEGDLVRVGLALYGVSPLSAFQKLLRPVLSWRARITFLNDIPKGHHVSYGGTFTAPKAMKIAVLPAGYADGYPRQLSGKGAEVLIRGKRCPVIGRVTMDQIMADVSKVRGVKVGDEAVLVGKQGREELTATEVAAKADTIPWHLFCGITGRVAYRYKG